MNEREATLRLREGLAAIVQTHGIKPLHTPIAIASRSGVSAAGDNPLFLTLQLVFEGGLITERRSADASSAAASREGVESALACFERRLRGRLALVQIARARKALFDTQGGRIATHVDIDARLEAELVAGAVELGDSVDAEARSRGIASAIDSRAEGKVAGLVARWGCERFRVY